MKVLLPLFSFLLIACSPTQKIIQLKGSYPVPPIEITSSKSFDEVWDKLIDLFAQKGLSIRLIDRSSGLLISGAATLVTTIEDKNGNLMDSTAHIVVAKRYDATAHRYVPITKVIAGPYVSKSYIDKPDPVYGEWNVRIKKAGTGTSINVNVVNTIYTYVDAKGIPYDRKLSLYKTTGRFESMIANIIK